MAEPNELVGAPLSEALVKFVNDELVAAVRREEQQYSSFDVRAFYRMNARLISISANEDLPPRTISSWAGMPTYPKLAWAWTALETALRRLISSKKLYLKRSSTWVWGGHGRLHAELRQRPIQQSLPGEACAQHRP